MNSQHISETYGEILPESVTKLISAISINDNDIFLDLGSGKGKVVTQIFNQTKVKAARGIEINLELHEQAELINAKLLENNNRERQMSFSHGSFFDVSFADATIVLIASPCFSPTMLHALGKKINKASAIRTVLSLRPIATLSRVLFKKIVRVECSWDTALCYIYEV